MTLGVLTLIIFIGFCIVWFLYSLRCYSEEEDFYKAIFLWLIMAIIISVITL